MADLGGRGPPVTNQGGTDTPSSGFSQHLPVSPQNTLFFTVTFYMLHFDRKPVSTPHPREPRMYFLTFHFLTWGPTLSKKNPVLALGYASLEKRAHFIGRRAESVSLFIEIYTVQNGWTVEQNCALWSHSILRLMISATELIINWPWMQHK